MNVRRHAVVVLGMALALGVAGRAHGTEIKGAAVLDHPCGKVAVKHMGLVHAGKLDEATKLGTKALQEQWKAMPAKDRQMMSEMMVAVSKPEAQLSAEIKAHGVLVVEGNKATLTVKTEKKDASGTSTETWTEQYAIDGASCWITH
ncbi:MAG TPA: hypothetical protein VHG32_22090 [Thermoanaerobaculia bacterium]|jgi:hypothetical protein|nr:hypothetical protein [Thermoanaerobaculia bacterium]